MKNKKLKKRIHNLKNRVTRFISRKIRNQKLQDKIKTWRINHLPDEYLLAKELDIKYPPKLKKIVRPEFESGFNINNFPSSARYKAAFDLSDEEFKILLGLDKQYTKIEKTREQIIEDALLDFLCGQDDALPIINGDHVVNEEDFEQLVDTWKRRAEGLSNGEDESDEKKDGETPANEK